MTRRRCTSTWRCSGDRPRYCAQHLSKGRLVGITGRLRYSEWEAEDGSKRSRHSIVAQRVEFLDGKSDGQPAEAELDEEGTEPVGAEA